MDIKDFIIETISAIADATTELQSDYEEQGVIINPPVSVKERDLYEDGGIGSHYRRVETVEFDIAVTAASETSGGGKAGLKILAIEAGADGQHSRRKEDVSRVKFSVPISLSPSSAEGANKDALEKQRQGRSRSAKLKRQSNRF